MLQFIANHHFFIVHLVAMGLLSAFGQMFVYRMIKQFKQHFPPFVITTRKIFTVGLSIFYFHHETNFYQLAGLFLVFFIVTYEFVSELIQERQTERSEASLPIESHPKATVDNSSVEL
jgi:drug/metabolite transporter (DMT)-like permease